mgnify:CR=1 FL=1
MYQNDISLPFASANTCASAALPGDSVELHEIRNEIPMVQVLVIEDSEAQIQLISGMLRKDDASRFDISISRDLREGLNQLSTTQFDVVLLDLTLPDSTGLESCIRLSEAAPDVSIVVLTGLDDEELAVSTLQHGAEDYLVKGQITSQLLVRATRYAIERKKSKLELQRAHDELEIRVQERTAELQQMQEAAALHQDELAHASRLDTLGEMASGLAHELNQPLMAIMGFTDHTLYMMRNDQGDSERCIELIEDAGKEAKRAGEIIKRMRRLVTKRRSQRRSVNLNKAVAETVPLIRPGLGVGISMELEESLPRVSIDRVQIQQVILNLARNAVQAMSSRESAQRELLLRTGTVDEFVFIEVADTGPGMSVEDLERLFDPFFSRKPDGLGLGLSISRTIVDAHGGRLTVKKNALTGLTFRLTLPTCDRQKHS